MIGHIFPASVKILQVIDNRTALIITANGSSVFVEDTRLDNAVDGQQIDLPGPFEVVERRTYTTVLGSDRTAFVLRRFDAEKNLGPWLGKEFD